MWLYPARRVSKSLYVSYPNPGTQSTVAEDIILETYSSDDARFSDFIYEPYREYMQTKGSKDRPD